MSTLEHAEDRLTPRAGRLAENFVAKLDHLGTLRFSGEEAEVFLQGQLSCDVAALGPRASVYGAFCSAKGRMLANFLLWRRDDGFTMVLSRDLVASVSKQISKFVLRSRVKVEDTSDSILLVGATGGAGERLLATSPPAKLKDGRLLFALLADAAPGALGGLPLADAALWRWSEIRSGLPLITAATQDQFIPQMANLELLGGISFDKGCYTGQEIIARTQHLGKVKRRMFLANVPAPARSGDALFGSEPGGQASGTVLNAEASPEGGHDLLAVVQVASRESSTVHLRAHDGPALRFLPLPYAVA
ncbi:MAG TPA: folate-binding protein [Burkholderiales bacterium]|nr:folate-binding protein [Burkholderiales bacterium]